MSENDDLKLADAIRKGIAARAEHGGIGVVSIEVGGERTEYDAKTAQELLERVEKRAARRSGRRPTLVGVDLSKAW
jgi:hypothetical protein